jgi:hypothetical protein
VVESEASGTLEDCLARIRQLEEENAHLREAAKTFGDLAERLKRALDAELRQAGYAGRTVLSGDRAVVEASSARVANSLEDCYSRRAGAPGELVLGENP